jgi:hypothetical protein
VKIALKASPLARFDLKDFANHVKMGLLDLGTWDLV